MRIFTRLFLAASLLTMVACQSKKQVDILLYNGIIYTVDSAFAKAEAMAVLNGRIEALGSTDELLRMYDAKEKTDLHGKAVYPGLIDAHCHFFSYGCMLMKVDLTGTKSFDEVLERTKKFSQVNKLPWLLGGGWDQNDWDVKEYPSKEKLDEWFPSIPVVLNRIDGHAVLCNQAALDKAHITPATKVNGGEIILKNGKPSGILIDNAANLVKDLVPAFSQKTFRDALLSGQESCLAAGLTTVCDAGLGRDSIELIDAMQKEGKLKLRVYAMVSDVDADRKYYLEKGPYKTERLDVRSFKMYGDGALGSRGACLLAPYSDEPGHYGFLLCDTAHMSLFAKEAFEKGFQLNTHCIGDSGVRTVLKVYANILQGKNDRRWRIEHCQVVDPSDYRLFTDYDILPSVQPTHATSDMYWAADRLGTERCKHAYAYNDLMKAANGNIAFGTDCPVESINPMLTFYAAIARQDIKGYPPGGFQPENKVSRDEALKAMTLGAAYACFGEKEKGSLEKGKFADFVILDRDIMSIPSQDIPLTKVVATYINGERLFGQ